MGECQTLKNQIAIGQKNTSILCSRKRKSPVLFLLNLITLFQYFIFWFRQTFAIMGISGIDTSSYLISSKLLL
jgi:hypothetical protein